MSGSTSQPNLNSIVAALQHTPRDTGLDLAGAQRVLRLLGTGARAVLARSTPRPRPAPPRSTCTKCPAASTPTSRSRPRAWASHRWPEIARTYAEVNQLFGDIVKVTPSSKVVGDMALFLFTRGIKPQDVVNLEPGVTPFPASVIDMLGSFFYGLKPGEEMSVEIEPGKTLFMRLINVGAVDKDGRRTVTYELNGMTRETHVLDKSVKAVAKTRAKADPADPLQVGAPIPGIITSVNVSVGNKVAKSAKLFTMEAMKMQTTIYAAADGVVSEIFAQVGESVESKDLLMKLRA
jgi:pyruvate carboxylase